MWSWIRALVLLGSGFPSMEFYGIGRKLPSDTNWNEIFFQKIPNTNQSSSYYGSSMRVCMIYIWYTYDICVQSCHAMRRDASFKAVYIMYVMYVMYVVWRDMTWCDVYIHICLRIRIWRFSSFVSCQKKTTRSSSWSDWRSDIEQKGFYDAAVTDQVKKSRKLMEWQDPLEELERMRWSVQIQRKVATQ